MIESREKAQMQEEAKPEDTETPQVETKEADTKTAEQSAADQKAVSMLIWLGLSLSPLFIYGLRSLIMKETTRPGEWILLGVSGLAFYFVILLCVQNQVWRYHQGKHRRRFMLVFLAGLVLTFVCSFMQPLLWLYLPLGVALLLCSDLPQAFAGYFLLLFLQMVLSNPVEEVFLCYALIGCVGILLFSFPDDSFLFGVPLFCSLLFQTLLLLSLEFSLRGYFLPESFCRSSASAASLPFCWFSGAVKSAPRGMI